DVVEARVGDVEAGRDVSLGRKDRLVGGRTAGGSAGEQRAEGQGQSQVARAHLGLLFRIPRPRRTLEPGRPERTVAAGDSRGTLTSSWGELTIPSSSRRGVDATGRSRDTLRDGA